MHQLQRLDVSHALAIAELWADGARESAHAAHLYMPNISISAHADLIARQLAQQERLAWGALSQHGQLLAYITASIREAEVRYAPERYLKIHDLDVAVSARRLGLGRQLVQHLREFVRQENLQAIEVNWIINDPVADAFWRSQGFQAFLYTAHQTL